MPCLVFASSPFTFPLNSFFALRAALSRVSIRSFDPAQCPSFTLLPMYKASRVGDVVPVNADVVFSVTGSALHVTCASVADDHELQGIEAIASAVRRSDTSSSV